MFGLSSRFNIGVFVALWLCAVGFGLTQMWKYQATAGRSAHARADWPCSDTLTHAADRPTLVMILHPHCPCSRASLAELSALMARGQGRVDADVLFVQYAGVAPAWVETDTWRAARAIPGVRVLRDPGGALAHRFGAFTSGQTYLYDAQGRLRFSGGITAGRGHEGDNAGLDSLRSLLAGMKPVYSRTPVFGCPVFLDVPHASTLQENSRSCPR